MSEKSTKLFKRSVLIIALSSLLNYLFAHMAYLNMNTDAGAAYEYVTLYLSKILDFTVPVAVSVITLYAYAAHGLKKSAVYAIALSSARTTYYLPYYYIIFIFNYGYDSLESITLSLLSSLGVVIFTALFALVSISIYGALIKKRYNKKSFSLSDHLPDSIMKRQSPIDVTQGANLAFLVISMCSFVCRFIPEIIDTVSFFIEYGLDYRFTEILTIMGNYLLLFALTAGSYLTAVYLKNRMADGLENVDDVTPAVSDYLEDAEEI